MRFLTFSIAALASVASVLAVEDVADEAPEPVVKVDITHAGECERRTKNGDKVSVHYRGTLAVLGKEFDASYGRGVPISFVLGQGRVIKGWDENLGGMCIGDKRTLTIPPEFGYGQRDMGPIPAGSTLIFETELVDIEFGDEPASSDEPLTSTATPQSSVEDAAQSTATEAAEATQETAAGTESATHQHEEL